MLSSPGPALLEQNLAEVQIVRDPGRAELDRVARSVVHPVYALFDLALMPRAVAAARHLRVRGASVVAVRGRVVPASVADAFTQLYLGDGFTDLLRSGPGALAWPTRWSHPVVLADLLHARDRIERVGVVFSRLPESGVLDVDDLGRAGVREGAVAATLSPDPALATDTDAGGLPVLVRAIRRNGGTGLLLVDTGGAIEELAAACVDAGVLRGFLGTARRGVPDVVRERQIPVYTWFEAEDEAIPTLPETCRGCAYVPVAIPGESVADASRRLDAIRQHGYTALVPRFFLPVPATAEWESLTARFPLRHKPGDLLDGTRPIFALPGWDSVHSTSQCTEWTAENQWPETVILPPPTLPAYSLGSLRTVLDGVLASARREGPDRHARDLMEEVRRTVGSGALEPLDDYPFLAWNGDSVLSLVDGAVERRLRSLAGVPAPLAHAMSHTALAGGKRIRPILALTVAGAHGVDLITALPAAVALEWLHTASLVQDDLPSMDDDPVRRRIASAHVRHGEGIALLASDALVAMAFEDVAALAHDPGVGPAKASALVLAFARALGALGVVGGQARDLLARDARGIDAKGLLEIHRRKTAPLFRLAATIGTVLGDAAPEEVSRLETWLADLGVAFQIVDDLLDVEARGDGQFGRPPGSDARNRRLTFASALRRDAAARIAEALVAPLTAAARSQPGLAGLAKLAGFVLTRAG